MHLLLALLRQRPRKLDAVFTSVGLTYANTRALLPTYHVIEKTDDTVSSVEVPLSDTRREPPDQFLTGAELALLWIRNAVWKTGSLEDPVRFPPEPEVLPLWLAARRLAEQARVFEVIAATDNETLLIRLQPVPVDEAEEHHRWMIESLEEDQREYGRGGPTDELLVIGRDGVAIGKTRWADLLDWHSRYVGAAWGGGLDPPRDGLERERYAAVVEFEGYCAMTSDAFEQYSKPRE